MKDILLVSFGSVIGANTRFLIYKKLEELNLSKDLVILIINTFASFLIGLFLAILPQINFVIFSTNLVLFFSIGFLGSLSTFSTFVYDLFELFIQFRFLRAFNMFIFSSALGLIAVALGFFLGHK